MTNKKQFFKQIHKELKDKMYRLCLGYMGNTADADDLFQDVLLKIWNNLDNFREESNISTWVYRITTNTALLSLNKRNKSRKNHINLIPQNLITENNQGHALFEQDKINKLYKAISNLKEIDRIIISLVLEGNSYKEIADITGINTTNVGVRINRIKKNLVKKL